jgi:hypothetical protein
MWDAAAFECQRISDSGHSSGMSIGSVGYRYSRLHFLCRYGAASLIVSQARSRTSSANVASGTRIVGLRSW